MKEEKFKIVPAGNRVIVKALPNKGQKLASGLYIPGVAKDAPRAEVVAIGDEYKGKVKIGDIVLYQDNSGYPFSNEGQNYLILYGLEILAIDKT